MTVLGAASMAYAAADHQAGEVRVLFHPAQTSADSIGDAITDAGYEVAPQGPSR